jgi:hypothetical protein
MLAPIITTLPLMRVVIRTPAHSRIKILDAYSEVLNLDNKRIAELIEIMETNRKIREPLCTLILQRKYNY